MAVDDDQLPERPADAVPIRPSLAEQQRAHEAQQPPTGGGGDQLPPPPAAPLMGTSWTRIGHDAYRGLGLGTRAVAEGLGGVVGGVGDILTAPGRLALRAVGYQPPKELPWMQDLTVAPSTQIKGAIDTTGLPTPATPTEQNISTFEKATTAGALGGPRAALTAGGGTLASEKVADSDLVPWWAKPTVRLVGDVGGTMALDKVAGALTKLPNYVKGVTDPIVQAFDRLRIPTNLAGTVSGSPTGQSLEAYLTRAPVGSSIVRGAQQQVVDDFGRAVDTTASQLSPKAVTPQTTGEILQNEARNWRENVNPAEQTAAWAPLNQRMAGAAVDPAPYRAALERAASPPGLATLPENQRAFASAQAKKWLDALNADAPPGQMLTWEQAHAIKQRIGDAMGTPEIVASLGNKQLQGIYGGLSEGMKNAAVQHGQGSLFNTANQVTTDAHTFIDNTLSKIIRTNNPRQDSIQPEDAAKSVLNSGDTDLQALRTRMPDAADAAAALHLRQMATAKPGQASAPSDTSTGTFLTNMNQMRQNRPGGADALFGAPSVQQQIEDLTTVAGRLRDTQHRLNTSGTAEGLQWAALLGGIPAAAALSGPLGAAAAASPLVVNPIMAKAMTNRFLTRLAATPQTAAALHPAVAGLLGSATNQ